MAYSQGDFNRMSDNELWARSNKVLQYIEHASREVDRLGSIRPNVTPQTSSEDRKLVVVKTISGIQTKCKHFSRCISAGQQQLKSILDTLRQRSLGTASASAAPAAAPAVAAASAPVVPEVAEPQLEPQLVQESVQLPAGITNADVRLFEILCQQYKSESEEALAQRMQKITQSYYRASDQHSKLYHYRHLCCCAHVLEVKVAQRLPLPLWQEKLKQILRTKASEIKQNAAGTAETKKWLMISKYLLLNWLRQKNPNLRMNWQLSAPLQPVAAPAAAGPAASAAAPAQAPATAAPHPAIEAIAVDETEISRVMTTYFKYFFNEVSLPVYRDAYKKHITSAPILKAMTFSVNVIQKYQRTLNDFTIDGFNDICKEAERSFSDYMNNLMKRATLHPEQQQTLRLRLIVQRMLQLAPTCVDEIKPSYINLGHLKRLVEVELEQTGLSDARRKCTAIIKNDEYVKTHFKGYTLEQLEKKIPGLNKVKQFFQNYHALKTMQLKGHKTLYEQAQAQVEPADQGLKLLAAAAAVAPGVTDPTVQDAPAAAAAAAAAPAAAAPLPVGEDVPTVQGERAPPPLPAAAPLPETEEDGDIFVAGATQRTEPIADYSSDDSGGSLRIVVGSPSEESESGTELPSLGGAASGPPGSPAGSVEKVDIFSSGDTFTFTSSNEPPPNPSELVTSSYAPPPDPSEQESKKQRTKTDFKSRV